MAARWAVLCAAVLVAPPAALGATNPIQDENARPGTPAWATVSETTSIEAYTDRTSAAPGEAVGLHVAASSPGLSYRIQIFRLGWYARAGARLVACLPGCDADKPALYPQPPPSYDPSTGKLRAGWPESDRVSIGTDWVSGYYEARVLVTQGEDAGRAYRLWFVVREPVPRASAILVQVPVNTWQAYNSWGGRSLYDFNSGGARANHVSFDRPYAVGVPGSQATPMPWEVQLVRFLEGVGADVSYQTDVDTDRDPGSLLRHRLVMTAGHSEYWTKAMRDGFDRARDQGTNLAFMGSNVAYWQVRYEDDRRTLVGYKGPGDPIGDRDLNTIRFRDLAPPRPECELVGVQFKEENLFSRGDYTIPPGALADPWFGGTGFTASSVLTFLVADEHDSIPDPAPASCSHPGLQVLFRYDAQPAPAQAVRYVAPSGARVFATGTMQFSWGLDAFGTENYGYVGPDPRLQQFMRNALEDLLRPAAPEPLTGVAAPGQVRVTANVRPDPRVQAIAIVRHAGPDDFDPAAAGTTSVCRSLTMPCVDRIPGHGVYRYAATAVDQWGSSRPAFSAPVPVPNAVPSLVLAGPRTVHRGSRVAYVVRAADLDGDTLSFRWTIDGKREPATGPRLATRFVRTGRHRVAVTVRDGHGGGRAAALTVRVR